MNDVEIGRNIRKDSVFRAMLDQPTLKRKPALHQRKAGFPIFLNLFYFPPLKMAPSRKRAIWASFMA